MKIYTKVGDKGQTSLISGRRVAKNHPRIEAYGTVDELMAHTALLMDMLEDAHQDEFLWWVQDRLMTMSAVLAMEGDTHRKIPQIKDSDITRVEEQMDELESGLDPVHSLILPGGHPTLSQCHVARTVCRRAERCMVGLTSNAYDVPMEIMGFINRLSDYFFVLSRKIANDCGVITKKWIPVVE